MEKIMNQKRLAKLIGGKVKPQNIFECMYVAKQRFLEKNPEIESFMDLWKDLTRVYTGKELHQAIIARCIGWGVDCSRITRKWPGYDPKVFYENG